MSKSLLWKFQCRELWAGWEGDCRTVRLWQAPSKVSQMETRPECPTSCTLVKCFEWKLNMSAFSNFCWSIFAFVLLWFSMWQMWDRQTDWPILLHIFKSCNAAKNPPMGRLTLPVKLMIKFLNVEYGPLQPDTTLGEGLGQSNQFRPKHQYLSGGTKCWRIWLSCIGSWWVETGPGIEYSWTSSGVPDGNVSKKLY